MGGFTAGAGGQTAGSYATRTGSIFGDVVTFMSQAFATVATGIAQIRVAQTYPVREVSPQLLPSVTGTTTPTDISKLLLYAAGGVLLIALIIAAISGTARTSK